MDPRNRIEPGRCVYKNPCCCQLQSAVTAVGVITILNNVYTAAVFGSIAGIAAAGSVINIDSCTSTKWLGVSFLTISLVWTIPSAIILFVRKAWVCLVWILFHIAYTIGFSIAYVMLVNKFNDCLNRGKFAIQDAIFFEISLETRTYYSWFWFNLALGCFMAVWFIWVIIAFAFYLRKNKTLAMAFAEPQDDFTLPVDVYQQQEREDMEAALLNETLYPTVKKPSQPFMYHDPVPHYGHKRQELIEPPLEQ